MESSEDKQWVLHIFNALLPYNIFQNQNLMILNRLQDTCSILLLLLSPPMKLGQELTIQLMAPPLPASLSLPALSDLRPAQVTKMVS